MQLNPAERMQSIASVEQTMIGYPFARIFEGRETLADGGMSRRDTLARGTRRNDRALKRHPVDILDTYQSSRKYRAREFARS